MRHPVLSAPLGTEAHNLADLIDLYESNYVRLMSLVPELAQIKQTVVSRVAGAQDLYLTVSENFRYTTSLRLTYAFRDGDGISLEPHARICVYHDARAVELVSHCRRRRSRKVNPWQRVRMPDLERRWEMNWFLRKWLRFCTHQGHLFLACMSEAPASDPFVEARSA
ncbi:MAG TPA: DUF1249 domain-containing protein [Gammaproteobacteria bacterium]|jgi:hypothetical protein